MADSGGTIELNFPRTATASKLSISSHILSPPTYADSDSGRCAGSLPSPAFSQPVSPNSQFSLVRHVQSKKASLVNSIRLKPSSLYAESKSALYHTHCTCFTDCSSHQEVGEPPYPGVRQQGDCNTELGRLDEHRIEIPPPSYNESQMACEQDIGSVLDQATVVY